MSGPLVTLSAIRKTFGTVIANDDVSIEIGAGEVLALLGENGAGKSTLMKILYGFYQPDGGTIQIEGSPVDLTSPRDAMAHGIGMVFQQFSLVPALSVLENLLAALPYAPWLQWRGSPQVAMALRWLDQLAPNLDPQRPVRSLSVGERQLVGDPARRATHGLDDVPSESRLELVGRLLHRSPGEDQQQEGRQPNRLDRVPGGEAPQVPAVEALHQAVVAVRLALPPWTGLGLHLGDRLEFA